MWTPEDEEAAQIDPNYFGWARKRAAEREQQQEALSRAIRTAPARVDYQPDSIDAASLTEALKTNITSGFGYALMLLPMTIMYISLSLIAWLARNSVRLVLLVVDRLVSPLLYSAWRAYWWIAVRLGGLI